MLPSFFSLIDLFGIPIAINLFGKEKLKSPFGGFCSLLFFGFLIFALYNASNEMINHLNPKTVSSRTFNDDPREMILTADSFPMAFGLRSPGKAPYPIFIDDSIYLLNLTYRSTQTFSLPNGTLVRKTTVTPVSLERCTKEHFGDHAFAFSGVDLSSLRCIAFNQPYLKEMKLQGYLGSQDYGILYLELFECNSETSNGICASESERKKYIEGSYFGYMYANMVIDPNDYTTPDARYQDTYSKSVSRSLYKETKTLLSHVRVLTDSGWLSKEESQMNFVMVDQTIDNSLTRDVALDLKKPLFSASFEVSKLETTYTRSYKKILTVLAEVASLANTVLLGVAIVLGPFLRLKLSESIVRELFDVKIETNQKEKPNREQSEQRHLNELKEEKLEKNKVEIEITRGQENNKNVLENETLKNVITKESNDKTEELVRISKRKAKACESGKGGSLAKFNGSQEKIPELKSSYKNLEENRLDLQERVSSCKDNHNNDVGTDLLQSEQASPDYEKIKNSQSILSKENGVRIEMKELKELEVEQCDSDGFESFIHKADQRATDERVNEPSSSPPIVDVSPISHYNLHLKGLENVNKEEDMDHLMKEEQVVSRESAKSSQGIDIWEYLYSFVSKDKELKKKRQALKIGKENIDERLDVANMLKKMREIDKMRALFFDKDQLVLFNNLPKPEINLEKWEEKRSKGTLPYEMLKDTKFLDQTDKEEELLESYRRVSQKEQKTLLDERLLEIFNLKLKK